MFLSNDDNGCLELLAYAPVLVCSSEMCVLCVEESLRLLRLYSMY